MKTMLSSLKTTCLVAASVLTFLVPARAADAPPRPWYAAPLSLEECVDLALEHNAAILKGKQDLQATYGVVIQTRAIAMPKVRVQSEFTQTDRNGVESFAFLNVHGDQKWNANIQIVQSIYEGGRLSAAIRAAKLSREQALLSYETVVADTLRDLRVAFYDTLLASQQIAVHEASIQLLRRELEDQNRRYNAGTVPRFNVLRAEVELANSRPKLIRARNTYRVSKSNLANLLGLSIPGAGEDLPIQLAGTLVAPTFDLTIEKAIATALDRRTELAALTKSIGLREEGIKNAQGGYKPSVQIFAGYGSHNSMFTDDLTRDVSGWSGGARLSWDIFDGQLTRGKVQEARALAEKSRLDLDDTRRKVELEVRTAYSNYIEARELQDSQKKTLEQAEEALRLANARAEAGTGTQLDVLSAQTSLTESRTTQIVAEHDLAVALTRLDRATGNR